MAHTSKPDSLLSVAADLLGECHQLAKRLSAHSIAEPSLAAGATTEFWSSSATDIAGPRTKALGLIETLGRLIQGPHEFLHEYVSSNWEHGALYTVLQFNVLEKIPENGYAHVGALAAQSGIPENKLLRILRLLSCKQILNELDEGVFCHTAISEDLVRNDKFKAWVEFQLFETRIASAHLADSLMQTPNDYGAGQSAFKHAWGLELYDWHAEHPEKAARFRRAMQGVTQSLDPADQLFCQWFEKLDQKDRTLVVEIGGRYGYASTALAEAFPGLSFEIRDSSHALLQRGEQSVSPKLRQHITFTHRNDSFDPQPTTDADKVVAYAIRNVLWNWSDEDVIRLLQTFVPVIQKSPSTPILISDGISPSRGSFDPHVEQAYRRRDITMMTMHNVKQRTHREWTDLFAHASPHFKVTTTTAATSHVYKGLWELRWVPMTEVDGSASSPNS